MIFDLVLRITNEATRQRGQNESARMITFMWRVNYVEPLTKVAGRNPGVLHKRCQTNPIENLLQPSSVAAGGVLCIPGRYEPGCEGGQQCTVGRRRITRGNLLE
jgi:hypothetical protein